MADFLVWFWFGDYSFWFVLLCIWVVAVLFDLIACLCVSCYCIKYVLPFGVLNVGLLEVSAYWLWFGFVGWFVSVGWFFVWCLLVRWVGLLCLFCCLLFPDAFVLCLGLVVVFVGYSPLFCFIIRLVCLFAFVCWL